VRDQSRDALVPFEPSWASDDTKRSGYKRRLKRYQLDRKLGVGAAYFLVRKRDEALVGACNLSNIVRGVKQSASVGYWSGVAYRRHGYVRAGLTAVAAFALGPLGLHRVEAACLPENKASIELLQSVGFRHEGIGRSYLKINGEWQDHELFSCLAGDLVVAP